MRRQINQFQMIKQDKTPEELSEIEISKPTYQGFKVMIIKMINELGRRINEYTEKINKDLESTK